MKKTEKRKDFKNQECRRSKGFTLVELLITLALLSMILMIAFSMQIFGARAFNMGEAKSDNQFDVRMAGDFITKQVRNAKTLEILYSTPTSSSGYYDIYLDNGKIVYDNNGVKSVPIGISNNSYFTLSFTKESDSLLDFSIGKTGDEEYDISSQVDVLNLFTTPPYTIQTASDSPGIGIRYTIGELNDQQAVEADKDWLSILYADNITGNVYLPSLGPNGTSITWSTSNASVVSNQGVVNSRTDGDVSVTMTAAISRGSASDTKTFILTLKKANTVLMISSINNINVTLNQNQSYTLPQTVQATMSDGTVQDVHVSWNTGSIDTSTTGIQTITGTVNGYKASVTLTANVVQPPAITSVSGNETQLIINFDKAMKTVTVSGAKTSVINNVATINFIRGVGNNESISVQAISTDGGSGNYILTYKNNPGWKTGN